ncbi:hypothetical protein Acr_14g0006170 [Actinidia rufa]|uniref:Uncharacterized protein n=1 Tax=Actinidia rufa TaxID=165716 RepID=A0A7J0FQI6_9ERIC|nr:hypothetical protein Acr_14g0006170 [Actinidia rufa]
MRGEAGGCSEVAVVRLAMAGEVLGKYRQVRRGPMVVLAMVVGAAITVVASSGA